MYDEVIDSFASQIHDFEERIVDVKKLITLDQVRTLFSFARGQRRSCRNFNPCFNSLCSKHCKDLALIF